MRRGYVPGRWGQVHYREAGQGRALVCLHATAYSSRSLVPLMQRLAGGRRVVGLDTPGYGQSDPPPGRPEFAEYAAAIGDAVQALADGPVDLFGYHTGALLAVELAAARPEAVRRAVLIGIPAFDDAEKPEWRARLVHPTALAHDFEQFRGRWDYLVTRRPAGMTLDRAFANFADELLAYPREWWAHAALFRHDPAPALAQVGCPVLVINPDSPLAPQSRRAASMMRDALVMEMPDLSGAILDAAAERLALAMEMFLDPAEATAE